MIKTYIFDFDGTIGDTLQLAVKLFNELSPIYKYSLIKDENIAELKSKGSRSFLSGLNISPNLIGEVIDKVKQKESDLIANVSIFEGVPQVLKTLKDRGNGLGILTSNLVKNVELLLDKYGINIFDFIVSENDLFAKDVILKKVLAEKVLLASETVYVGDEDRDITAAKKAELRSVAVTWGFNSETLLQSTEPNYLIRTPQELLSLE